MINEGDPFIIFTLLQLIVAVGRSPQRLTTRASHPQSGLRSTANNQITQIAVSLILILIAGSGCCQTSLVYEAAILEGILCCLMQPYG